MANSSFLTRMQTRCATDVDFENTQIILIACFFCSGLVNSVATTVYGCFVMMQTGNTIFLAIGVTNNQKTAPAFPWVRALTAISSFCLGSLFFSNWHRQLGPIKRGVLMGSFFFQTCLLTISAALISARVVSHSQEMTRLQKQCRQVSIADQITLVPPWLDLLPVSLLSFQSAGQVYASRALRQPLLPTVVLTAIYCDLISGIPNIKKSGVFGDAKQNARVASIVCLFLGAVIGGVLSRSWMGPAGVLWIAAVLKALMTFAWLIWKPETSSQNVSNTEPELS